MTIHKKHEDNLHVQLRTKILDQYGNPIQGAIEYDPGTGYGKRIKDPALGLVEQFYCKDGSIEVDGHNFDDTNHDPDKVEAIKTLIDLKVNRNQPEYADILQKHVDRIRNEKQVPIRTVTITEPTMIDRTFTATSRIDENQRVQVDLDTGLVSPVKENIINPTEQQHEDRRANNERQQQEREQRLAARDNKQPV
jgi:hypothetical protein